MPLGFLQFDEEPEGISKQLDEDLSIINGDLPPAPEVINPNTTPFITEPKRKPAFKPAQPVAEQPVAEVELAKPTKSIKSKKPLSEKQKAHLEKMRLKRIEKKKSQIEKKMEKSDIVTKVEAKSDIPVIQVSEEELIDMDKKEFEKWIKNMDKFERMMNAMEKEKERENEKLLKIQQKEKEKELALERRIREKIKKETEEQQNVKYNKPTYNISPAQPILQQPTNDYGEYSNMFGY